MTVFEKISAQQGCKGTFLYEFGEQLKCICEVDSKCAELVFDDLDVTEMNLKSLEKKIEAFAKAHKGKISIAEVDAVIRDFYKLPEAPFPISDSIRGIYRLADASPKEDNVISLDAFL